jgi:hypothetical protein
LTAASDGWQPRRLDEQDAPHPVRRFVMAARKFFCVCTGLFLLALSYHMGAGRASAQSSAAPETAILTGTLPDGGTIPLPHYTDGTEALERECKWIVSVNFASANFGYMQGFSCYTTGRVVTVGVGGSSPLPTVANYMIIATRGTGQPTPTSQESWGSLKSRYSPSHAPTSQTPTNR